MATNIQKQENSQDIENSKNLFKKKSSRKNIKELFADYDGEYEPVNIQFGERIGKEIW